MHTTLGLLFVYLTISQACYLLILQRNCRRPKLDQFYIWNFDSLTGYLSGKWKFLFVMVRLRLTSPPCDFWWALITRAPNMNKQRGMILWASVQSQLGTEVIVQPNLFAATNLSICNISLFEKRFLEPFHLESVPVFHILFPSQTSNYIVHKSWEVSRQALIFASLWVWEKQHQKPLFELLWCHIAPPLKMS